ncbi:MAG: zinc-binding dehydrogenase [Bacteroidetes bacterium]|nr:MAG: zinc-binding dehydrogenase [Bacteroidota bacterium]
MKRKAYRLKAGNIRNLKIAEENLPDPGENEVTIEVKAIGLNFADVFAIWGLYSATPEGVFTPGLEYSGIVAKTGKNVSNVKPGDRIMGVTRFGAYTTHLNIDARYVIPLPEDWSFEEGAGYLVQVLTAYYGLINLGALQKGMTVLIHSAAGGVGIFANRIAQKYEAYTIGTVGNAAKLKRLEAEGYQRGIVRGRDFEAKLTEALDGRELNLVMECIGGEIFKIGFKALGPQGRMIIYGAAQYAHAGDRPNIFKLLLKYLRRPRIDAQSLAEENKGVLGFNLIYLYERAELMHQLLGELSDLNIGKPIVGHTFPFEKLPDAIRTFKSGKTMGKVVIQV